jgi:hypothetical protein
MSFNVLFGVALAMLLERDTLALIFHFGQAKADGLEFGVQHLAWSGISSTILRNEAHTFGQGDCTGSHGGANGACPGAVDFDGYRTL